MLVNIAKKKIVRTNGAVLPTQIIASITMSLQMRNKMTEAIESTKRIVWMITATKMIEEFKVSQTRAKTTNRKTKEKETTACLFSFPTQTKSATATGGGKGGEERTNTELFSDGICGSPGLVAARFRNRL